jgi:hypothetical protein
MAKFKTKNKTFSSKKERTFSHTNCVSVCEFVGGWISNVSARMNNKKCDTAARKWEKERASEWMNEVTHLLIFPTRFTSLLVRCDFFLSFTAHTHSHLFAENNFGHNVCYALRSLIHLFLGQILSTISFECVFYVNGVIRWNDSW